MLMIVLTLLLPMLALGQGTGVFAEAVGQANLRATTDTRAALLGQIVSGTRYPVIGRSELYPWVLLGDVATLQPIGWVFQDLLMIYGDLTTVPFSTLVVTPAGSASTPTLTLAAPINAPLPSPTGLIATPSPTAPTAAVVGTATGEINIRYGPGVEYPRIGIARPGDQFEITGWHTQFPWIQIRYSSSPNGYGWVSNGLLEVRGDIFSLPPISQTRFELPALTATPAVVQPSRLLAAGTPVPLSPPFQALGDELWSIILSSGFDLQTSTMGALFLMDLRTGEAITFGSNIAFSGMSINKIAILTALFGILDAPPSPEQAFTIASAMICSENTSTNAMLEMIGGGDALQGAAAVTAFMQQLGLERSFIITPFLIDPASTPIPLAAPITSADQISAQPDGYNQMTVDEIGWLLASIYQCAYNDSGALLTAFPGQFNARECQQILHVMSFNRIGALLEAGVPEGTRVAHKHGWIYETHGDAGVVFTPGGDFALVTVLHNPTWLDFNVSFPLVAEITRTVYNYFNPQAPLLQQRDEQVPAQCDISGSGLLDDLTSSSFSG